MILQAAVGKGYAGDIAIDDVTFTDGACKNGSEPQGTYLSCLGVTTIELYHLDSLNPLQMAYTCHQGDDTLIMAVRRKR